MLPYFPFGQRFNDKMGTAFLSDNDGLVEVDEHYRWEVGKKRQQLTELPIYYYQSLPGTELAQWEVLKRILTDLTLFSPDQFSLRQDGDHWHWHNKLLNEETTFTFGHASTLPIEPLDWLGRQVQEDLILLAGREARLVAGQLCFANDWCLDEKLNLPFWHIHTPLVSIVEPMMQAATKLMERLPVGRSMWRLNWSVKVSDQLDMTSRHLPALKQQLAATLPLLTPDTIGQHLFLRIERQTLTRLPLSGAILFTIHTYHNRLADEIRERPEGANQLANVFGTTPRAMLNYKSMSAFMPPLLAYLHQQIIDQTGNNN